MSASSPFQSTSVVPQTASWGRRALALLVDWFACTLIVAGVLGPSRYYGDPGGAGSFYVLGVLIVETAVFTTLAGGSFGKLVTRLRTVRADGDPRYLDPLRSLARAILVAAVIPPLIFRPDGRGLHDIVAGTTTVTLDTYLALRQPPGPR